MGKLVQILFAWMLIGQVFAANDFRWGLSGILPGEGSKVQWVVISKNKIEGIYDNKLSIPNAEKIKFFYNSGGYIFPGLMDLHAHTKQAVLPLWKEAKSQFNNRFEWRNNYPKYKKAMRFNMEAFKDPKTKRSDTCLSSKWAEAKALVGGTTAILGAGRDIQCVGTEGVLNLENNEQFLDRPKKVSTSMDIVSPWDMKAVYGPQIKKFEAQALAALIKGEIADQLEESEDFLDISDLINQKLNSGIVYQMAYQKWLSSIGVLEWLRVFKEENRNFHNGLWLCLGDKLFSHLPLDKPEKFGSEELAEFLTEHVGTKLKAEEINNIVDFFFNKRSNYFSAKRNDEREALYFLTNEGVTSISRFVKEFISDNQGREKFIKEHDSIEFGALVTHLAEGTKADSYNQSEFRWASHFGYIRSGLVIIHGMGLSESELERISKKQISMVWSPVSNLLLYGETLDVGQAIRKNINISLGADWSLSGSKNLLDELKIARQVIDQSGAKVSNKELVNMVTINPAKALRLDHEMGKIEKGYLANIVVIKNDQADKYDALVNAEQEDLAVVIVNGEVLYGDEQVVKSYHRESELREILPQKFPHGKNCSFKKLLRGWNLNKIESDLEKLMEDYETRVTKSGTVEVNDLVTAPNPLFKCEDQSYQNFMNSFLVEEKLLNQYKIQRERRRMEDGLTENWSPLVWK